MPIIDVLLVLIIFTLIGVSFYQNYLFSSERQKLLDRIMSRSYQEYRGYSDSPEENHFDEEESNYLDIEAAKDKILEAKE